MSIKTRAWWIGAVATASMLLAWWQCTSFMEGVYRAVPPIALVWNLTGLQDFRASIRARFRKATAIGIGAIVVSMGVAGQIVGPQAVLDWRFWWEVCAAWYFVSAFLILLFLLRRSIKWTAEFACRRCQFSRPGRVLFTEIAPLVLFFILAVPLGMAFSHVHRFKLPNFSDPQRSLGREYENIDFVSADGTRLRGWWIPAQQPSSRTLVFCHGIAMNRSTFLPFVEIGDWLDANVLMFDLRGHGDSGGRTVTNGHFEHQDALAAIAYARTEKPAHARQIVGMGVSLGAATMALAAAEVEPPLDAVILDSSFVSTREMTAQVLKGFPSLSHAWLTGLGMPIADWHAGCAMTRVAPEASIHRLRAPVLFLHSRGDPLIPSSHSERLFQRAAEPKRLKLFELSGHCDAFFADRVGYREAISIVPSLLK